MLCRGSPWPVSGSTWATGHPKAPRPTMIRRSSHVARPATSAIGIACSGKSRTTIRSSSATSCSGETPSCAPATSKRICRTSRAAWIVALPVWWVTRLANVPVSRGLESLSTRVTLTLSIGTPSSWAAICRITVRAPCPISTLPRMTSTLPSGRIFTTTWLGSPPPLIPVEYQTAAMPTPRFFAMCASALSLARRHLQQIVIEPDAGPSGRRLHHLDEPAVVLNGARRRSVAVVDGILEAQSPRIDPHGLGDPLYLHVPGEGGLEEAEAPHRAGRPLIGEDGIGVDPDVGDVVGARHAVGVLAADVVVGRRVGPSIADRLDLARDDPAVLHDAVLEPHVGGGAVGGSDEFLLPRPNPLDRPPVGVE